MGVAFFLGAAFFAVLLAAGALVLVTLPDLVLLRTVDGLESTAGAYISR